MKKYISIFIIIISISCIGVTYAIYQKNLTSNTITIKSNSYSAVTATITAVSGVDNTFDVTVTNNNPYAVRYKIIEENDTYNVEYDGSTAEYATIEANNTATVRVVFSGRDDVTYENAQKDSSGYIYENINIALDVIKPYDVNQIQIATGQLVYLDKSAKNLIIEAAGGEENITSYQEGQTFGAISSSSEGGLCSVSDSTSGETIYFYRGNVTNNYVSFAGYTWRILRINADGSLRLILDSVATTSQYQTVNSTSTNNTVAGAIAVMNWVDSVAYTNLHTWYNTNIAPNYSDKVVESEFVFDTTYVEITSTGSGNACAYFGAYERVGKDIATYIPTFGYDENSLIKDYVGLITGDELTFAGGHWETNNTSYFLYNSSITTNTWTMSPSFWDEGNYKIGMMVLGPSGSIHDWPTANTLTDTLGLRPVISIRGDLEMSGDGTKTNPYQYVN